MTIPNEITGPEIHVYSVGADRARKAYRTRHGANVTLSLEERRAWNESHAVGLAAAALRGGMAAVRKMHSARVEILATMSDASRVGGSATGDYLATITRDAEHASQRLEVLATIGKATRKAPSKARKLASVPDVAPIAEPAAVDNTPAAVESRRAMFAGLGWSTTAPSVAPAEESPAAVESAPVVAARKRSRFVSCDSHRAFWSTLSTRDKARWFVEGGPSGSRGCAGEHIAQCNVWGGTDYYAPSSCTAEPIDVGWNKPREIVAEPVAEIAEPVEAPAAVEAPETVPEPMPAMSRAARKATRREIAATMRAAGVKPEGQAWRDACRAAGLPVSDDSQVTR